MHDDADTALPTPRRSFAVSALNRPARSRGLSPFTEIESLISNLYFNEFHEGFNGFN